MQGDSAKAKAAYQDFLTLWKDADPDIPILIAAKAEYAKVAVIPLLKDCDAGVTQNLPTLPKLTSLTVLGD